MAPEPTVDLGSLLGTAGNAQNLQLLQILSLLAKDQKKGPLQGVGDVLQEQRARRGDMADSYAPSARYEAGWEPGGLMDHLSATDKAIGMGGFNIDDNSRLLNPQSMDDLGGTADALGLGAQIRDSGDQGGPYDTLIGKLIQTLMPVDPATSPAGAGSSGSIPGGTKSGTTQPGYNARSAPGPMGARPHPSVPVTPSADHPSSQVTDALSRNNPQGSSATISPANPGNQSLDPSATAALVATILQRAHEPAASAGPNRKNWGANTPGSKHPAGYQDGGAASAPVGTGSEGTLIRVGERSHKDKKYASEEVVFAPPGTVVAPVPKGMENPSHEDAVGLIMSQLLKNSDRETAPHAGEGHSVQAAAKGYVTNSASKGRAGALTGAGNSVGNDLNYRSGQQTRQLQERQMFINRDQGNRQMDIGRENNLWNYDLGLRGLGERRYEADSGERTSKYSTDKNFELGNNTLNFNREAHQDEVRNWEAERTLKKMLGMRGLDIDQQKANQDFQLGSAQQAFAQIMAGITGSALPGVRAGRTPMLGLLG